MFNEHELLRLAAEHQCYLDRMIPIIRERLRLRGGTIDHIEHYIRELPSEHFKIVVRRVLRRA